MTQAELLFGAITTLVGVVAGLCTSYYFFRAQQATDFNKIFSQLNYLQATNSKDVGVRHEQLSAKVKANCGIESAIYEVEKNIAIITLATDAEKISKMNANIESLKESHKKLESDMARISEKTIEAVQRQQEQLTESLQAEIMRQMRNSKSYLHDTLKAELVPLLQSQKTLDQTVEEIGDNVGNIVETMVKFAQEDALRRSNESIVSIKNEIGGSLEEMNKGIHDVSVKTDILLLSINPPDRSGSASC